MKLLLDENMPLQLKKALSKSGHDVNHINNIAKGKTDADVFALAQKEKRCIITNDVDFTKSVYPPHYGIIKFNGSLDEKSILLIIKLIDPSEIMDKCYIYDNKKEIMYEMYPDYSKKGKFKKYLKRPAKLK